MSKGQSTNTYRSHVVRVTESLTHPRNFPFVCDLTVQNVIMKLIKEAFSHFRLTHVTPQILPSKISRNITLIV